MNPDLSTDVLIVGGGPVGLTLAHELTSRGVEVVLVEPRTTPDASSPRCKQVNPRSMEHYRRLGVADDIRAHSRLPFGWSDSTVFCTSLTGRQVTRFDGVFALDDVPRSELPEPAQWTAQSDLEAALRATLVHRDTATTLWGSQVTAVTQSPHDVTATVLDPHGHERQVRASYLAACDGGRSPVRQHLGIALSGRSHGIHNLQVVFDAPGLADAHSHGPAVQYWVLDTQVSGLLGRLDTANRWWAIIIDAPTDADAAWVQHAVHRMVGGHHTIQVRSTDPWTARMLVADTYSAGRSYLLGDAAHLNPPWGGFGANTGIGDAVNLGWKLAAAVQGWGGVQLLASYEAERRPVAHQAISAAEANMAVLTPELANPDLDVAGPAGEQARADAADAIRRAKTAEFYTLGFVLGTGYPTSPIVVPDHGPAPRSTTSDYHPSAAPGMRLPHLWVDSRTSLYDLLGPGLTLLQVGAPPAPARWKAAATDRGLPWTQLTLHRPNTQTLFGARYLLVRPDHVVAWRGDELSANPNTLLDFTLGGAATTLTTGQGRSRVVTSKVGTLGTAAPASDQTPSTAHLYSRGAS